MAKLFVENCDINVLRDCAKWIEQDGKAYLLIVLSTWGSSPRPAGSIASLAIDGKISGSVSGGCVEDDLIEKVQSTSFSDNTTLVYGESNEDIQRFNLPCGGVLKILLEPFVHPDELNEMIARLENGEIFQRIVDIENNTSSICHTARGLLPFAYADNCYRRLFGPTWKIIIIGANEIASYLADICLSMNYHVIVCDPREAYAQSWSNVSVTFSTEMPDDLVLNVIEHKNCAVVAVSHDPKLDDMALMEALKSPAFYVGAIGSKLNSEKRRLRLSELDLNEHEISRLHAPIGLKIGSKTPPEIAVSIAAEITAVRYQVM